jgi:hypothetical protein
MRNSSGVKSEYGRLSARFQYQQRKQLEQQTEQQISSHIPKVVRHSPHKHSSLHSTHGHFPSSNQPPVVVVFASLPELQGINAAK